jgi:cbb3-type cytochrome oxidase maturation protein
MRCSIIRAALFQLPLLGLATPALASHLSGGEPDIIAPFAAVGILLILLGLMLRFDLIRWRTPAVAHRLGILAIAGGIMVVLIGAAVAGRIAAREVVGGLQSTWLQVILPLVIVAAASTVAALMVLWWGKRSGQFDNPEALARRVLDFEEDEER